MIRQMSPGKMVQRLTVASPLFHYLAVAGLLALLYVWSMPRLITLEDAGLFHMVCATGGIAHPPGYPLFTLICAPVYAIPGLAPIIAGNLISVVCACATGVVLFRIASLLFEHVVFGYVTVLPLAVSAAFWSQAIIVEVYTLNTLLFCALLLPALHYHRAGRNRDLYLFAFVFGLALSNHWPLILLSAPGLALLLWPRARDLLRSPRLITHLALCVALMAAGLLPYLVLVLKRDPVIALYGPVAGWDELVKYVTRAAYSDGTATADWVDKGQYLLWLARQVVVQFGWTGFVFILLGAHAFWQRHDRTVNLALWLIFLGSTVVLMLLLSFDFEFRFRSVLRPYPLIAYIVLSLMLAQGIEGAVELIARPSLRLPSAALAGIVVAALAFAQHAPVNDRSTESLVDRYARLVLATVAPGARIVVEGDEQTGALGYLHHIEGVRPDVELFSRDNLVFPNRLASPFAPSATQSALLSEMIDASPVPVYALTPLERPGVHYGLFFRYAGGETGYRFLPEHTEFLKRLLAEYEAGEITDPHTRAFVQALLLKFSHQYVGYAFSDVRSDELTDDFLLTMERLRATFAGKLMMLEYVLRREPSRMDKLTLLELARAAELQIPDEIKLGNRAMLYQMIGRIFLLRSELYPPDPERASLYLERSIEVYPTADNPSVCELALLLEQRDEMERADALRARFALTDRCPGSKAE